VKNLYRICVTAVLALLMCLMTVIQVYAASSVTTNKKYKPRNVKIEYGEFTVKYGDESVRMANMFVTWTNGSSSSDKVVELYCGDNLVCEYKVDAARITCDIHEEVVNSGPGTYKAYVYATRTGDEDIYVAKSESYKLNENRWAKLNLFDSDMFVIEQPWLDYSKKDNHLIAHWDEYPDVKKRMVCVKKGTTVVSQWSYANTNSKDISDIVAAKGAGTYTVGVFAVALGDAAAIYSDEFEVTNEMAKDIKQRISAEQAAIEAGRIGWYNNRGITWYYYKDYGVKAKNEWLAIDGDTYYFTSAGIMQTGWQVIDDKYYFFGTDGKLLRNATSPEGYKTNADGARVDSNGAVISAKGQKKLPSNVTLLKSCSITVSETGDPGTVKKAEFKDGTGYVLKSVTMDIPQEQWTAGSPVRVKLVVEAKPNYYFDSSVKFSVRGTSATSSGNQMKQTLEFWYYPKMQLRAPEYIYLDTEGYLHWKYSDKAAVYKITIESPDYESSVKLTVDLDDDETDVKKNNIMVDLNGYLTSDPHGPSLKIYAVHSSNSKANKYYTNSPTVTIADINEFARTNTIEGTVQWKGRQLQYLDSDGEPVSGWVKLFDNWYFLDAKGYAHDPGWFKHIDGNTYYFDSESRMVTGAMTDENGKTYFFNDGSNKELPLGALVN